MNDKTQEIKIAEKVCICGKYKMWAVTVVFAFISMIFVAMLSSVEARAANVVEDQAADMGKNQMADANNVQEQITVKIKNYWNITTE